MPCLPACGPLCPYVLLLRAPWPVARLAAKLCSSIFCCLIPQKQSAEAARPRLERLMAQLELRGLRPSPLNFQGDNFRYDLLPQVSRAALHWGALCCAVLCYACCVARLSQAAAGVECA